MPGPDPNIINRKELDALNQFKERIPDIFVRLTEYEQHDVWLLKWIRANNLDVRKGEAMLRKCIDWKIKTLTGVMDWRAPDLFTKHYTLKTCGFDKDGCVISILPLGKWDFHQIVSLGLQSDFVLFVAQFFMQATKLLQSRSTKDHIFTQFVFVMDFEGFAYTQLASKSTIDFLLDLLRLFENYHPEVLKACFVVNAPKIFEILFALVKPLLTMRTLSKVRVFGSNTVTWRSALLENIEPDQLPSHYGGSNTTCKDYKVEYGSDVFPVYEIFNEKDMTPVIVEASTKHSVEFELSQGSQLSWNFRTDNYDIGFSVLYSNSNENVPAADFDADELFSCPHVDSHLHLQKGAIIAEKPGTYTLLFDNSFSRFRSKNLFYNAHVDSQSQSSIL